MSACIHHKWRARTKRTTNTDVSVKSTKHTGTKSALQRPRGKYVTISLAVGEFRRDIKWGEIIGSKGAMVVDLTG